MAKPKRVIAFVVVVLLASAAAARAQSPHEGSGNCEDGVVAALVGLVRQALFWQSIEDTGNATLLATYLEQWPDGVFAPVATYKLEELGETLGGGHAGERTGSWLPDEVSVSVAEPAVLVGSERLDGALLDKNGWTALHYAAALGRGDVVAGLLDETGMVNIDAQAIDDGAPLTDRLKGALRTAGRVEFEQWTRDGETALHLAAAGEAYGAVVALLTRGAAIDARTHFGWTPLHYAVWGDARGATEALIDHGAEIEARVVGGWTPLHLGVWAESRAAVEALLARGASVSATNEDGNTAADLVKTREMKQLLGEWR